MSAVELTNNELLSTTRAVRRRLDLTRPVKREVIEECIALAQQAPSGSNLQLLHFVVVTDPEKRAALAEVFRRGAENYKPMPISVWNLRFDDAREASRERVVSSLEHLVDHLAEVPALVVPCIAYRPDADPWWVQCTIWGSILPAAWSFCLAARARGLATCLTSIGLAYEEDSAKILGIPFPDVMQGALIPLAYSIGTEFKPAYRLPVDQIIHWDTW
jgi:nitroreductase